ncbi:MAG: alpha/beta hydrolase domain-containing protein [Bryobacterales bacterium]|nr:alpha/beta hydrolase domain-containing protein [Bryobacteraceae bacterium]MDW8354746.1 alpha/beta hydrolase domain-containing protein [Bryobacterales bacterium]
MRCAAWTVLLACTAGLPAAVVRIEVDERSDVLDGRPFGRAGPYERIIGKVHFAVDPALAANRILCDIDLAPRNAQGLVAFTADLYVLKPRDPALGNGTLLFEVVNRGRKLMLGMFQRAASLDPREPEDFGDSFLLERGFTLAWLGWQWDVPEEPLLMRLYAPTAREGHRPIRGLVRSEHIPDRPVRSFSLADRTMRAYPAAESEEAAARLSVRDRPEGPRRYLSRNDWIFARERDGRPVPDRSHVYLLTGTFEPGRIYEVIYTAQDPVLVGLGLAAVRDFVSFLKYGTPNAGITQLGDQRRYLKRAIAFGASQSGRFLRTFLYQGFNADEDGRRVFDAVWAHVAGAGRGSFNHRFAQPSRDGHPFLNFFYPTDLFPFTDLEETDPETGARDGLLRRAAAVNVVPKIFYTNGSYEYYGRAASLIHTTPDGRRDAAVAPETRIYFFAGSQHGPAEFPPSRTGTVHLTNPHDFRWVMRALLVALDRWVTDGTPPPESRYPRLSNGTLVEAAAVRFPKIPGVRFPKRLHRAWRVDYGPEFATRGIVSLEPPKLGKPYPVFVAQLDGDGNEIAGIRLPDVAVPLATYTGWNFRHPSLGAPEELYSMAGSFLPFARTKAERLKNGDPRPSVEERYPNREAYLERVAAAARQLASDGLLLEQDVNAVVRRAAEVWDFVMRAP